MRKVVLICAALIFARSSVLLLLTAHASEPQALRHRPGVTSVTGEWLAQTRDGVFEIKTCGDEICGQLIGMDYDGPVPRDVWGRSQCNLTMLYGFRPAENGRLQGKILDPGSGKTYDAFIWNEGTSTLKLRGYVLDLPLLGRTETWTRFHGRIGPDCKMEK